MINKIIKKDLKSNLIPFITSGIVIVLITIVLTIGYPSFIEKYENIYIYVTVLASILLALLNITLLVYILINNFHTDKRLGYINDVRSSSSKYLYYRIAYAFSSLFIFILLYLITFVITTEVTWIEIFSGIDLMTVVIVLNVLLVYFCFLMAVYYQVKYSFRLPKRVIIISILLILSLLTTLYMAVGVSFLAVIINTMISYLLVVGVLLTNINENKDGHKFISIVEVILVIIILCSGALAIYFESQSPQESFYSGPEVDEASEGYEVDYKVMTSKETIYGDMIITNSLGIEDGSEYFVYIDGELNISATISDYSDLVTITNMKTGEVIDYEYNHSEGGLYLNSNTLNTDTTKMQYCYIEKYGENIVTLEDGLSGNECLSENQKTEIIALHEFLTTEVNKVLVVPVDSEYSIEEEF